MSSPVQGSSPAKTWASVRLSRAHAHHRRLSTNCYTLSERPKRQVGGHCIRKVPAVAWGQYQPQQLDNARVITAGGPPVGGPPCLTGHVRPRGPSYRDGSRTCTRRCRAAQTDLPSRFWGNASNFRGLFAFLLYYVATIKTAYSNISLILIC